MRSAAYAASTRLRATLGRRGVAILLALAIEALIALLLLLMAPDLPGKPESDGRPTVFGIDVSDAPEAADRGEAKPGPKRPASAKPQPAPPKPREVTPPPPPKPVPEVVPPLPSNFIRMTRDEFRQADIAKAPSSAPAQVASNDAGDSDGPSGGGGGARPGDTPLAGGKAPNGEPLYAAEWYRRPTHAELSTYLSPRAPRSGGGWGLVACKTVARYHVEDCQELGESPRGSGLAGSVRQAAWQFLVRPPRIGGREQVGTWVSIRIDYTITKE